MGKTEMIIFCILFFTLALISSHNLVFSAGTIIHHDWPIPPYRELIIHDFPTKFFSAWQDGTDITLTSRSPIMLGLINRLLSLVFGINGEILSKMYLVFAIWFSGFVMYYVGRAFKKSQLASLLAGFVYMFSPWLFDRIIAGDLFRMLAYVLYPLCFYFFVKSIVEGKGNEILYLLLIGILLYFVDVAAFMVIFSSLILYSVIRIICFSRCARAIIANAKALLIIFCVFFISNLSWMPIHFIYQQSNVAPLALVSDLVERSRNAQIINVIRGMGSPIGWFSDIVSKDGVYYQIWAIISFLIPIIAFSAVVLDHKNGNVPFFSLLAIISAFLGKGVNPPLGQAYLWAYNNIVYFQIFRDPNKWVMNIPFTYAFLFLENTKLFNFILPQATRKLTFDIKTSLQANIRKVLSIILVLMLLFTISISSYPFLRGDFGGVIKAVNFPESYQMAIQWLSNQSGDFRVLWLPPDPYTQYDWIGSISYQQHDLIATYSPKPNLMIYSSSEFGRFSYFIASALYQNTTRYLAKILAINNVKFILLRNDAEGWWWRNFGWTREKLNYIIQNQEGLRLVKKFGPIDVYENQFYTSHNKISATTGITLISGGFSSLTSITYLDSEDSLDGSLFFVEQIPTNNLEEYVNYAKSIVIKDGDFFSFAFSFVPEEYIIKPSNYALYGSKTEGWATLYSSNYWRLHRYYLDSVEECAITSTNASLNMPLLIDHEGRYEVWIKSFWHPRASLIVTIDGEEIGETSSQMFNSLGYSWLKVGSISLTPGTHVISIRGSGSIVGGIPSELLVSKVAVVPEEIMKKVVTVAINATSDKNIMLIFEAEMTRFDRVGKFWVLDGSFGLNASQGLALTSKSYGPISYDFFVPKSGNYELSLRATSSQASKVDISVDGDKVQSLFLNRSTDFKWFNITTLHLSLGSHVIQLAADSGASIDLVLLKSIDNQKSTDLVINDVAYQVMSPTKYKVHTSSQGPYFLFFDEPYDNEWKASVNGVKIDSVPTAFGSNSFFINETMKKDFIIIEFTKQIYFELGSFVSLAIFLAMVLLCTYKLFNSTQCVRCFLIQIYKRQSKTKS